MKELVGTTLSVVAMLALAAAGCSSSSDEGSGGAGGNAGSGGTGGAAGMAGQGGAGGTGGVVPPSTGIWTGTGDGPDGAFTICFGVNEEGTALVRPLVSSPGSTCSTDPTNSFAVEFQTCEGALLLAEDVPITDGGFELVNEQGGLAGYWIINGTFDGNSASGEATVGAVEGTCTGTWQAAPVE